MLINPLAFRMGVRRRAERITEQIRARGEPVFEVAGLDKIQAAIEQAIDQGVTRLILAGGDGTVQAAVTWLVRTADSGRLPELVVLGGGRTNFVARDLGTRDRLVKTLQRALEQNGGDSAGLRIERRRTLKLAHPDLGEEHAFFVAGGSIDHVIRNLHAWRASQRGWKGHGSFATQAALIRFGIARLRGREGYRPRPMTIETDTLGRLAGPVGPLLVTTLPHDNGLLDPYAARGHGPLRLTAIRTGAARFWTGLPAIARGRFGARRDLDAGYLSGACNRITFHGIDSLSVDGQEYDLDPDHDVEITPGPELRFLRP